MTLDNHLPLGCGDGYIMTELKRNSKSLRVQNPALGFFHLPPTDMSVIATREVKVNPTSASVNPISFEVAPSKSFIDLDHSRIEVEIRLMTTGGNNLAQGTVNVLANNFIETLFKQIVVRLNGTLMTPQTDTYHHLAYIQTLLNHDREDL